MQLSLLVNKVQDAVRCEIRICIYFEVEMCYSPAVQEVESLKNISEVQSHFLFRQVAPAHYVVQETALVSPENSDTYITHFNLFCFVLFLKI